MAWDVDKFLVREVGDSHVNLSIGEPFFLQDHMFSVYEDTLKTMSWNVRDFAGYPTARPEVGLQDALSRVYGKYGKHIVVTAGAKQALFAGTYAFMSTYRNLPFGYLGHQAPHWPSYRTLADMYGLDLIEPDFGVCTVGVITEPNNPDGSRPIPDADFDIWDAAYAHPVYGWNGRIPNHAMSVWSASKIYGLSGIRVGWLVTDSKEMADLAAQYVEQTVSGISPALQKVLATVINRVEEDPSPYEAARESLLRNGNLFRTTLYKHIEQVSGLPKDGTGMFAWFKAKDPVKFNNALEASKVLAVPGKACGGEEGWYRMSMGHRPEVTSSALNLLSKELDK